jgi:tRNA pseudouridine55 synthase
VIHGVLVVDKPAGITSASVVEQVRRTLGLDRAGHGGTLDPIATGVLAVCVGSATKLAQFLLADDKAYEAEGVLGVETDTLDRTGRIVGQRAASVTRDALLAVLAAHLGEQDQTPPMYSAIKQAGVRLHDRARAGEIVERAARRIRIDRLELLGFEPPRFRIAIACSKGTYVRSLVADIGSALGAGAHLAELRRTRSGRFTLDQAVTLDRLPEAKLIPLALATDLPRVIVPRALVRAVSSDRPRPSGLMGSHNFNYLTKMARSWRSLTPRTGAPSTIASSPSSRSPDGHAFRRFPERSKP